jgi:hypothetical protein
MAQEKRHKKTPAGKGGEEPAGEKEENGGTKCQLVSAEACSSNLPEVVICHLYSHKHARHKKYFSFSYIQTDNSNNKKPAPP